MWAAAGLNGVMQPFGVVDELDVRLDVVAPRVRVVPGETLPGPDLLESLPHALCGSFGQQFHQTVDRAAPDGFIGGHNRRSRIAPGRLQTGIRFSLPGPVDSDYSLIEVTVREFPCLGIQPADRLRLSECLPDRGLVIFLNPGKDNTNIARLQSSSSRLYDGPIHSIAMSGGSLRSMESTKQ